MDYRELPAPPGLGLACVWSQTVPGDAEPYVQRVVPDACVDLIWSEHDGEIHVAGPDTAPFLADIPAGGGLSGVRFLPGLAGPALGVPLEALRDGRVPLRELWGDDAAILNEAIAAGAEPATALARTVANRLRTATPADPAATALVTAFTAPYAAFTAVDPQPNAVGTWPEVAHSPGVRSVQTDEDRRTDAMRTRAGTASARRTPPGSARRYAPAEGVRGRLTGTDAVAHRTGMRPADWHAAGPDAFATGRDAIRAPAGAVADLREAALVEEVSVREVAVRLGLSERQLRRRSLAAFGYGPKTLQRILRFQRALELARRGTPAAEVAYAMGYADQAHFAHEVRDLAGVPLTELLAPAAAAEATTQR